MPLVIPGPSPVVPVLPGGVAAVLPLPVRGRIPGSRSFDAGPLAAGGGVPHGAPPHHVVPPVALPTAAAAAALSQGTPLFTASSSNPWASPSGRGAEGADADEDEAALIALAAAKSLGIDDDD